MCNLKFGELDDVLRVQEAELNLLAKCMELIVAIRGMSVAQSKTNDAHHFRRIVRYQLLHPSDVVCPRRCTISFVASVVVVCLKKL